MKAETYTLNCDGCGRTYYDDTPFPKPQYCAICLGTYQAGIKEVVDWLETQATKQTNGKLYAFIEIDLQAKLKEWGIR